MANPVGNPAFKENPRPGPGRPKGSKDKFGLELRQAIMDAAEKAHPEGLVAYLTQQANANPKAFLALLAKIIPTNFDDGAGGPAKMVIRWEKSE
jgi:hypothetical protein